MVSLSIPAGMPVEEVVKGVVDALVDAFPGDGGQAAFETLATYLPSTINLATPPAKVYAHTAADPGIAQMQQAASMPAGMPVVQRERSRSRGRGGFQGQQLAPLVQSDPMDSMLTPPGTMMEVSGITDQRFQGTVTTVHPERGFGFIDCPGLHSVFNNKSIFVHPANISTFQAGDVVSFSVVLYQDGKPQAKDLRHMAVAAHAGQQEVRFEVELEPDIIGAFVGKHGQSIMELQKKAGGGVHIQVQPAPVQGGPQICTINGPHANAEYGRKLVVDKLSEIRRQRAIYDQVRAGQSALPPMPAHGSPTYSTSELEVALSNWDVNLLRSAAASLETFVKEKAANPLNALSLGDAGLDSNCVHMVEVEADIIGAFVGKKGQCIMDLQGKTGGGVHIQIHPPAIPGGNQFAEVSGPKTSADLGILLVRQKLDELRHTKTVHDRLRTNGLVPAGDGRPPQMMPTAPGLELGEVFTERVSYGPGGQASYEVDVPAPLVGALVGKRGSVIMELQTQSGACVHIQVHPPVCQGAAQVCEVTGPMQNAEYGSRLVKEKLADIREQRALNDQGRIAGIQQPQIANFAQPGYQQQQSVGLPMRGMTGQPATFAAQPAGLASALPPQQARPQAFPPQGTAKPLPNTQSLQDTMKLLASLLPPRN